SDAVSYFLKGLAEMDLKDSTAAFASLHSALSIKPNFPEAAYHLALYTLQTNQKEEGLKLLQQALKGAKQMPADKLMLYTNGTAQQFIESINASIAYYQGRA
ncbi:MAG: hypothetical protein K2X39_08120, partial [Silvanigrellaceae bacterium]|nr:hypothetical protein [Silvanigrellaceae bacterium]